MNIVKSKSVKHQVTTSIIINNNKMNVSNNFDPCSSLVELDLGGFQIPTISFEERRAQLNAVQKENYELEKGNKSKKVNKPNYLQLLKAWLFGLIKRDEGDSNAMPLPDRSKWTPTQYDEQLNLWLDNQIATKTE